ncbi:MAG: sodium-dependent transporter [Gammaproteobacteria bacterium]|nr:MAG: sodium-dependent transporter [Gammaproteobacteria bacterium]
MQEQCYDCEFSLARLFAMTGNSTMSSKPKVWAHKSTFVLAAAGAAIGLGNIWKFPYMVGEGGGGAFVLVYLLCIILISLPLMIAETLVGRYVQRNPLDAIRITAKESGAEGNWTWMAVVGMLSLFLIFSFFSVVGGWSFAYAYKTFAGEFNHLPIGEVGKNFAGFLAEWKTLIGWHTAFAFATGLIVALGIIDGIERGLRWLMPLLLLLIIFMLGYSVFFSGGFSEGLTFLFHPDFSKINQDTVLSALGQAFFTLNVGLCVVMAYAAYTPKSVSIMSSSLIVVFLDTLVAILMGIVIFPIVFAQGLDPAGGPGLLFVTLTAAFADMQGGQLIGGIFFLLVSVAALTSSISMVEGPVSVLEQKTDISRKILVPVIVSIGWLFGFVTIFSFNLWADYQWLGKNAFDWIDTLTSSIAMPVVGLAILIFVGWVINDNIRRQELKATDNGGLYAIWLFMTKYIAPVLVLITLIYGIYQKFYFN